MNKMRWLIGIREDCSVVRKNQTTNGAVVYSEILNNRVENPGFPDFVEVT